MALDSSYSFIHVNPPICQHPGISLQERNTHELILTQCLLGNTVLSLGRLVSHTNTQKCGTPSLECSHASHSSNLKVTVNPLHNTELCPSSISRTAVFLMVQIHCFSIDHNYNFIMEKYICFVCFFLKVKLSHFLAYRFSINLLTK